MNRANRHSKAKPATQSKGKFSDLMNIDYLVFSSHKTATQSVKKSLNKNGFSCKHCHHPNNIGLELSDLPKFARRYRKRHGRKLQVLSIFREPISRHISSFFQTHGWKPLYDRPIITKGDHHPPIAGRGVDRALSLRSGEQ